MSQFFNPHPSPTDEEAPTVECPADIREVTTEKTVPIMFEDLSSSDNLNDPVVTFATVSGDMKVDVKSGAQFESTGLPVSIIVTARDSFSNEASCTFTVTVYKQGVYGNYKLVMGCRLEEESKILLRSEISHVIFPHLQITSWLPWMDSRNLMMRPLVGCIKTFLYRCCTFDSPHTNKQ